MTRYMLLTRWRLSVKTNSGERGNAMGVIQRFKLLFEPPVISLTPRTWRGNVA